MVNYKLVLTPVDMQVKVSAMSRPPVADLTLFKSLADALECLMFTYPDITYA
jgi:hypothetical protein